MTKPDAAAILRELERALDYLERQAENHRRYYEAALNYGGPSWAATFDRDARACAEAGSILEPLIEFARDGTPIEPYPSTEDEA